jgi:TonB family protein
MENEPVTPTDQIETPTRQRRVATRLLLAFLAIVAIAGFGTAIWNGYFSASAVARRSLIANPLLAYADIVRQTVQNRMDAEYAKTHVPGQGKSLKLRIGLNADGELASVEVERTSGSAAVDEFAMRVVRESAPFGPPPVQLRKKTDIVTISTNFVLH